MKNWTPHARVYEINTWVWLNTLSRHYGQTITLETVPEETLEELASYHVDVIWLMGVWYHSKAVRDSALNYVHEYRGALPDITHEDVKGSAYAIGKYEVDARIGGQKGLEKFRERLQAYGLKLILDFVPNHVATDHPVIAEHPEYFVRGTEDMIAHEPGNFFRTQDAAGDAMIIAHGRDPYFAGWIDTAQFNAFNPGYRDAAVEVLLKIASLADGVRCDMAMLMLNAIFERTWGWTGLEVPDEDFWLYVIPRVLAEYPNFVFIAETYWNLDYQLQQQGFDFTYDKVAYDRLLDGKINGLYDHLNADMGFVSRNIRFIENHDEHRAASDFGILKSKVAAVGIMTLPGAVLLHDGQFEGRRIKLPVHIQRQPDEAVVPGLKAFYLKLLAETSQNVYKSGHWTLFGREAIETGDDSYHSLIAWGWLCENEMRLIIMNFGSHWTQARIHLGTWAAQLTGKRWELRDVLHESIRYENGDTLTEDGVRVTFNAHQARIYAFTVKE